MSKAASASYPNNDLEAAADIRKHRKDLKHLLKQVQTLLVQTESTLDAIATGPATRDKVRQLDRLRVELDESVQAYLQQNTALSDYLQEYLRKMDEANRKAAMSEQRSRPARNEARVQQLSEELTRNLRLERIDNAIKELLDFLADSDFFAANASTGRRRRLRALQNAIEKALQK